MHNFSSFSRNELHSRPVYKQLSFVICPLLCLLFLLSGCEPPRRATAGKGDAHSTANLKASITGDVILDGKADSSGVQVYIPGSNHVSITDADGQFTLDGVSEGAYDVMARADGYDQAPLGHLEVVPSEKKEYTLASVTLTTRTKTPAPVDKTNLGGLTGSITLSDGLTTDGLDLSRCTVILENTPYRTTAKSEGAYLFWNIPPGQYTLAAAMDGFEPYRAPVRILPGPAQTRANIQLTPGADVAAAFNTRGGGRRIYGTVAMIGADGNPTNEFDKVKVEVSGRPQLATTLTSDGSFELVNLAPSRYLLSATAEGYRGGNPVDVDLADSPEMNIQFTLRADSGTTGSTARIHGVALKNVENTEDMSGITVAISGTALVSVTDAEGVYTIPNIPPGSYTIFAQAEGFEKAQQGPIELQAGEDVDVEGMVLEPVRDYPQVVSTDPADGARGVAIRREISIVVRFSKKMDGESLRRAVQISPAVAFEVFSGKDLPDTDFDLVKIVMAGAAAQPVARFRTRYTITITEDAKDVTGLNMQEPYSLSLTTGEPAIVNTFPENRGMMMDLSPVTPVSIFFNAPMDPRSITADVLRIRPSLQSSPNISIFDDPESGWTRLSVSATWQPNTLYRVTVMRRVRTLGDNPLTNTPYTFQFRTPVMRPMQMPTAPRGINR